MKRRRPISVELTPLLDVIFIMLFMVMGQSRRDAEQAQNEAAQAISDVQAQIAEISNEYDSKFEELDKREEKLEAAEDTAAALESRLDGYDKFDRFAAIVTITLTMDSPEERKVIITDNKSEEGLGKFGRVIEFNNTNKLRNLLNEQLSAYSDEYGSEGLLIFSFECDRSSVLHSDCTVIEDAIKRVSEKSESCYVI